MRHSVVTAYRIAVTTLVVVLGACAQPTANQRGTAEQTYISAVVDGDTVDTGTGQRVRIIGIDAPEIGRDGAPDDCYAEEARDYLNELLYQRTVELVPDPTQDNMDRYGRLLRHVVIDGQQAAVLALSAGAAREYTFTAAYEHQDAYRSAEKDARNARSGLWGDCN